MPVLSFRVDDETKADFDAMCAKFALTAPSLFRRMVEAVKSDNSWLRENPSASSSEDMFLAAGFQPFAQGSGRNVFYRDPSGKSIYAIVSRTLSQGESATIRVSHEKIKLLKSLCLESGSDGWILLRFRSSDSEDWSFWRISLTDLDKNPICVHFSAKTGNFLFSLKRLENSTDNLNELMGGIL